MPPDFLVNVGYVLTLWCYIVITIAVITFALSFVLCWILQIVERYVTRKRVEMMRSAAKIRVEPQRSHFQLDLGLQMDREPEIPVARSQDQP